MLELGRNRFEGVGPRSWQTRRSSVFTSAASLAALPGRRGLRGCRVALAHRLQVFAGHEDHAESLQEVCLLKMTAVLLASPGARRPPGAALLAFPSVEDDLHVRVVAELPLEELVQVPPVGRHNSRGRDAWS